MNHKLALYGTSACHLCEEATVIVTPLARILGLSLVLIDIAGDESLEGRYGTRIPVLSRSDGGELCWPFDAAKVHEFLRFT